MRRPSWRLSVKGVCLCVAVTAYACSYLSRYAEETRLSKYRHYQALAGRHAYEESRCLKTQAYCMERADALDRERSNSGSAVRSHGLAAGLMAGKHRIWARRATQEMRKFQRPGFALLLRDESVTKTMIPPTVPRRITAFRDLPDPWEARVFSAGCFLSLALAAAVAARFRKRFKAERLRAGVAGQPTPLRSWDMFNVASQAVRSDPLIVKRPRLTFLALCLLIPIVHGPVWWLASVLNARLSAFGLGDFIFGFIHNLPMACALAVGVHRWVVSPHNRTPFRAGFVTFGLLGLALYRVLTWEDFVILYLWERPIEIWLFNHIGEARADIFLLTVSLPQFALAIAGGLLVSGAARVRITRTREHLDLTDRNGHPVTPNPGAAP